MPRIFASALRLVNRLGLGIGPEGQRHAPILIGRDEEVWAADPGPTHGPGIAKAAQGTRLIGAMIFGDFARVATQRLTLDVSVDAMSQDLWVGLE